VALLVIVCGALLMLGGAVSLLMGFDIVMTERGSAMTLGGVIALSGGAVTVGIGFALLRLSQILQALESRNPKGPGRSAPSDRPVVPLGGTTPPSSDLAQEAAPEKAAAGGSGLAMGAAVAGAAAAVGGIAWPGKRDPELPPAELVSDLPVSGLSDPVVGSAATTAIDTMVKAEAAPASPPSSGIADLEEELSRALAEPFAGPSSPLPQADVTPDIALADTHPAETQLAESASKASFAQGLSELLDKPRGRRRRALVADSAAESVEPDVPLTAASTENDAEETETGAVVAVSIPTEDATDSALAAVGEDQQTDPRESQPTTLPATPTSEDQAKTDNAETESPEPLQDSGVDDLRNTVASTPALATLKVLGTYNAGGRTYSMYSDGSVEAITATGVERFESMEALRKHLSAQVKAY
jgi:hypothetical protein